MNSIIKFAPTSEIFYPVVQIKDVKVGKFVQFVSGFVSSDGKVSEIALHSAMRGRVAGLVLHHDVGGHIMVQRIGTTGSEENPYGDSITVFPPDTQVVVLTVKSIELGAKSI